MVPSVADIDDAGLRAGAAASKRALFARAIRTMQEAGSIRADLDADAFAITLIALADGLQVQWIHDPALDMAAHIDGVLALVATR